MSDLTRFTAQLWADIRRDYESGKFPSLRSLATKHGVAHNSISKRAKREGWKKFSEVTAEAAQQAQAELRQEQAQDIKAMAEESMRHTHNLNMGLKSLTAKVMRDMQAGVQTNNTAQQVAAIAQALRSAQTIDRTNLRMDELPMVQAENDLDRFSKHFAKIMDIARAGTLDNFLEDKPTDDK